MTIAASGLHPGRGQSYDAPMTTPARLARGASIAAMLTFAGCGGNDVPADTGVRNDAFVAPGTDTGAASVDTGVPPVDTGVPHDAATATPDTGMVTGRTVPVGHCGARTGLYFPQSSWIYTDVHDAPLRGNSAQTTAWLASHGSWGAPASRFQIDTSFYVMEGDSSTPTHTVLPTDPIEYSTDCDPGLAFPVPNGGRIEGYPDYVCPGRVDGMPTDDCHMIVVDFGANTLWEAYQATFTGGQFYSSCNVAWDMTHDSWGLPPAMGAIPDPATRNWGIGQGCTGPDAAGFPMAPLLITVGDVMSGRVEHVIRFALPNDRIQRSVTAMGAHPTWVWPATHAGGPTAVDPNAPIYGGHWRLHDPFDIAGHGLDPTNPVVIAVVYGLQHYGMVLADGGNIPIMAEDASDCGTTWDDLWGSDGSHVLTGITPADFDVLESGEAGNGYGCMRYAGR